MSSVVSAADSELQGRLANQQASKLADFDGTMWPFVMMLTVVSRCQVALDDDDTGRKTSAA